MACNCIEELNKAMTPHNTEVCMTWYPITRPIIATMKIDSKKRGKPYLAVASFCPFCGKPYDDKDMRILDRDEEQAKKRAE